jgi:hypothetical protein
MFEVFLKQKVHEILKMHNIKLVHVIQAEGKYTRNNFS